MHYLSKRINDLPDDDKQKVITEILKGYTAAPETKSDKYGLALMADYTDAARDYFAKWGRMQGMSTGYHSLDRLTKGLVGGELIVVAGKTSHGKTTLAMNIANRVAIRGNTVLFVTLEMTHAQLTSRYMYINGGETEDYENASMNTVFQKNDELNWQDIDGLIAKAKEEIDVDLVVIDHLHYFSRELEKLAEDLGRITKEIKKNAIRYNIPVILISHVRKGPKATEAATIEDLRGSSYIAQDADIVLMVGQKAELPGYIGVVIEKNRNRGFDVGKDQTGADLQVASLKMEGTKLTDKYDG